MLNISIVLYHPDWDRVATLLLELLNCGSLRRIYLVDNSESKTEKLPLKSAKITYIYNNGHNLGYGAGHNVAIRHSVYNHTEVHLVMNSDVVVSAAAIDEMYSFMMKNRQVGLLSPHVVYPNGDTQYLCKLLPTPWDLFARRFLPAWCVRRRNNRFEMRDSGYGKMMNVPYLSGCFMMLRTEAVLGARLFDERYFMYPEDMDLCRTIHRDWLTLYYPHVTITHEHGRGSYHSIKLLWIHIVNMCRYFNKWGWFFDSERRLFNRIAMQQYAENRV